MCGSESSLYEDLRRRSAPEIREVLNLRYVAQTAILWARHNQAQDFPRPLMKTVLLPPRVTVSPTNRWTQRAGAKIIGSAMRSGNRAACQLTFNGFLDLMPLTERTLLL
jgi:hypothetical protein